MATVKLTASAYTLSNSNYMTVTNPSYMYDNISDTSNYATIRGRAGRSSNSTYYCYLNGFNFSAVPSNATVTGFTVKVKGYRNSYLSTGSSYRVRLTGSATNSAISGTTCSSDWGASATTLTIPTGSLTWSQIVNYGSGFSIQLRLRNSSTSSSYYPYLYIYGAEIEVTYTVPTTKYTVSGTTSVQDTGLYAQYTSGGTEMIGSLPVDADEGTDVGILIYPTVEGADLTGITVTDNGVDVTSSLVYVQDGPGYYQYIISNIQAAHTLVVTRVTTYTVSASSTDPTLTVSVNNQGTSLDITVGQPAVIFIGGSDFTGLHATDNDVDVTSSLEYVASTGEGIGYPPRYKYEIAAVNETHTIVVSRVAASPVRVKQNGS